MKERKGVNNIIITSKNKKLKYCLSKACRRSGHVIPALTSGREGLHLTQASPSSPYMFPTPYLCPFQQMPFFSLKFSKCLR